MDWPSFDTTAVFVGTEGHGGYSSMDDGVNWNTWGLNTGSPAAVLGIARSSASGGTDWMATTSGLYRNVAGAGWNLVTGGSGYIINDVAVDPNCPTRVYCALGFQLFRQRHRGGIRVSTDNGSTWSSITAISGGIPLHNTPIADVEVDRVEPRYVYAGAFGRGFWVYDWGTALPACSP